MSYRALHHAHDLIITRRVCENDIHAMFKEGCFFFDEEVNVGLELERDLFDYNLLFFEGFKEVRIDRSVRFHAIQLRFHRVEVTRGRIAQRYAVLQAGNRLPLLFQRILEKLRGLHVLSVKESE